VTARRAAAEDRPDGDAAIGNAGAGAPIAVRLDDLLADRGMTLTELAERVGITIVNLSILKNGRARAIRFTTLASLCQVLACQPATAMTKISARARLPRDGSQARARESATTRRWLSVHRPVPGPVRLRKWPRKTRYRSTARSRSGHGYGYHPDRPAA
jgi:putative transcriptional regulator